MSAASQPYSIRLAAIDDLPRIVGTTKIIAGKQARRIYSL